MTRMILLSLLLAGLSVQAQTITTTWADQSIVGVVTNDGNGYTWTAVISTLGPALPNGAAAVPTTPPQALAAAPTATDTTSVTQQVVWQSQPPPPPPLPTEVTVVPESGTIAQMGDYQSSLKGQLEQMGTDAFNHFTSAANIQGLSIPHIGAASTSSLPSTVLLSGVAGIALAPILFALARL